MFVHTHLEITSAFSFVDVLRLAEFWKAVWISRGFCPVVTDRVFLANNSCDPFVARFLEKVSAFPSINADGFDRASFHRWIAAYLICRKTGTSIITTESDVFNHSLSKDYLKTLQAGYLHIGDRDSCPAFAYGDESAFFQLIQLINNHQFSEFDHYNERPHLSDQDFIARYFTQHQSYHSCREVIASVFRTPNWESFPLVHYGNPFLGEAGINVHEVPKVDIILKLNVMVDTFPTFSDILREIHCEPSEFLKEMRQLKAREKQLGSSKWIKLGKWLGFF